MRWLLELILGVGAAVTALALCLPSSPPPLDRVASPPPAAPAPGQLPYTTSYTLRAKLDPATHRVQGSGTIDLVNTSRKPLGSLYFHLYLNAFKNDRTLFLRSPFGAGRRAARPAEYGYLDVKRLSARELGGVNLWLNRVPHSPSDPEDETDIELPLPQALPPGGRLTLDLSFEALLPSLLERTGHAGSFHLVAQWFPKLARLEPEGHFEHFAFHPYAEFYADFGRYDVTLDVPEGFVLGATGLRVSERREKGRRIERYLAEPVHDFAWAAWDRFVERRTTVHGVAVRLLHPPGHQESARATELTLRASLPDFSRRYGSYPYPNLTVIHPPEGAESAGGMEYPTLITTGGPWYHPLSGLRSLEALTVHELGHQWFYGLLASNEARAPFLDEGLTSYAEMSTLSNWLGSASGAELFGLSISTASVFRAVASVRGADEVIARPAAEFSSFQNLGALVYCRSAILIETLARVFGRESLDRALLEYARAFRFRHPNPKDLVAKIREHMGERAATTAERALFERGRVNFLVRELQNAPNRMAAGYFERNARRERVVPKLVEPPGYRSSATVYRHGSLEIPVEVLLISEDGTEQVRHWDGLGAFHVFEQTGASPLVKVQIDPGNRVLIEDRLLDNQLSLTQKSLPRVAERLVYWAALGLSGIGP